MKPYWKVTLWYVLFGVAWIFFSDMLTEAVSHDTRALTMIQTLKGWFYVAVSGVLIFHLMRKAFLRLLSQERDKQAVFRRTVSGAHHILLNYLNQMQLVTMEAERCKGFDPATIELSRSISEEAAAALTKLEAVERITSNDIENAVYGGFRPAGTEK